MSKSWNLRTPADWSSFLADLYRYRDAEKPITVTVQPYRKHRSTDANRFYWGCVVQPLAEFTGYTPAELHDEILGSYCGWETRTVRGHAREFPRRRTTSPSTMDTMDFKSLIEHGQQIAASLGVRLPDQEHAET